MRTMPLAGGWLAVAAHVGAFSAIVRCMTQPAPSDGWPFAAATLCAAALPLAVCSLGGTDCDALDSLTVSRALAAAPWCALFAVTLMVAAAGARAALRAAGAPWCATAAFASLAALAASPDVGGSLSTLHAAALLGCAASAGAFATCGIVAARVGGGRVALVRAHMAAAAAWSAVGVACVWREHAGPHVRMLGMLSEVAALLHVAASVV